MQPKMLVLTILERCFFRCRE